METIRLSLVEVNALATEALLRCSTSAENAASVARSIVRAEADGIHSHGLMRLPTYCSHAANGKVDGQTVPTLIVTAPSVIQVDARCGFAHPAIDLGLTTLVSTAKRQGIAILYVANSYNAGVMGHHVEDLANFRLVALGFANAPASIAPWGGSKPVFGTNPICFATFRGTGSPIVIDQAASVVARGEVMRAEREGRPIPMHWALDAEGSPTTNPTHALAGSMAPAGGYKGATLALLVEVLAGALTGSHLSHEASTLTGNDGGPPRLGQTFIAIDPGPGQSNRYAQTVDAICAAVCEQEGTRIPGERRIAHRNRAALNGVEIPRTLHAQILEAGRF